MAASTARESFTASADKAWGIVGDFEGIGSVFSGVEDVVATPSERSFSMMGMRITERLVDRSDATRTLTYALADGVPIEAHEASIHVAETASGCEIVWSVTTVPEDAQPLFVDTYQRALESLHGSLDAT